MTRSKNNDLWAEIPAVTELSPKELMKEQAAYLKERTKGLLTAEVVTSSYYDLSFMEVGEPSTPNNLSLTHAFYLAVPTIKYRYELFTVKHDVLPYPAQFSYESKLVSVKDEKQFLEVLKKILSSERTQRILSSLLSQAKA